MNVIKKSDVNDHHFRLSRSVSQEFSMVSFHAHDNFEIYFFVAGEVQYNIEDQTFVLTPGDVLVIPPGRLHRVVSVKQGVDYERYVLMITGEYIDKLMYPMQHNAISNLTKASHLMPSAEESAVLMSMIEEMMKLQADRSGAVARGALTTLLLLRLQHLIEQQSIPSALPEHRMQQVIRYINARFTEPLTLEEISEHFYISKYHLLRQFKAYTYSTVHNYIRQKRILLAKSLLKEGMPAEQVAVRCGFSSYAGFYQAFYKETGISPGKFK